MTLSLKLNMHCDKCGRRIRTTTQHHQRMFPLQQSPIYPIHFLVQKNFLNPFMNIPQEKPLRQATTLIYLRENRNNMTYRQQIRPTEYIIIKLLEESNKYVRYTCSNVDSYIRPFQLQYKMIKYFCLDLASIFVKCTVALHSSHRLLNVPILWNLKSKENIVYSRSRQINVTRDMEKINKIKRFLQTLRTNLIVKAVTGNSDDTEPDSLTTRFSMTSVNFIPTKLTGNITNRLNCTEVNCSNLEKQYNLLSRPTHSARNMNCYDEQRELRASSLSSQFLVTSTDSDYHSKSYAANTDAVATPMPISFMFTLQILMLLCILHRFSPLYEPESEFEDFFYNPPLTHLRLTESATTQFNYFLVKFMRNTYF